MKTYLSEQKAIATIRKNMTKAGCTEEHIESAISNYCNLRENKVVEIAEL